MLATLSYRPLLFAATAFAVAVLLLCAVPNRADAQPIGPTQPITLQHADSTRGYPDPATGENVIEFLGHVSFLQGVVHIDADRALLYEARNNAVLTGNVRVTQPDLTMTAPRAEYDGNTRQVAAPNGVTIVDKGATLRAGAGDYNMYNRRARFRNGVTLQDDKGTLRAASGEYFSLERRAVFVGGARAETDSGTITSRELTYWRDTRETYAVGDVVVISKQNTGRLTGDTLHHYPDRGYTLVTGRPKLVQVDTTRTVDSGSGKPVTSVRRDTVIIVARRMEAIRSGRQEYVATDSVKLVRGDLQAVAGRMRFLPDENIIALGSLGQTVPSDTSAGDSAHHVVAPRDTARRDTTVLPNTDSAGASPAVTGARASDTAARTTPIVWYDKSQLTGDTITIGLERKKLHWIDVERHAFAITQGKRSDRYDQLAGGRLYFDIQLDTLRTVRSMGLASSVQFVYDKERPDGVSRASGDTIVIAFDSGQASTVEILGQRTRAEIEYFPEKMVRGMERTFRLEGFRWFGRDGTLAAIDASLPKAPNVPDVKPAESAPSQPPRGSIPRRRP